MVRLFNPGTESGQDVARVARAGPHARDAQQPAGRSRRAAGRPAGLPPLGIATLRAELVHNPNEH